MNKKYLIVTCMVINALCFVVPVVFAQLHYDNVNIRQYTKLTSGGEFARVSGNFNSNSFIIKQHNSDFLNFASGFGTNSFRISNQSDEFSKAFLDTSSSELSLSNDRDEFSKNSFSISKNEEFAKPVSGFSEPSFSVANTGEFSSNSFFLTKNNQR
ncbi:MAG: hypothetical protein MUC39_04040 [Candidatus Omnitrophica bacterium]|jgi:hypothetical protein|nr:hypothetical protein [Candidatus Omnitrophota bacterium]